MCGRRNSGHAAVVRARPVGVAEQLRAVEFGHPIPPSGEMPLKYRIRGSQSGGFNQEMQLVPALSGMAPSSADLMLFFRDLLGKNRSTSSRADSIAPT